MDGVWLTLVVLFTEVLSQDGKVVYTDDDEYWVNGFTYHNPNDKRIFVPKRVGIGDTVNTATLGGKMIICGTVFIVAVIVIGVSFMLIRSELTSPELKVPLTIKSRSNTRCIPTILA
ncbi:DUF5808 domain-containing protein [Paenibacillus sp. KQZ6P-2]|uniref:DUF5808 domain-containing protein n=1 Tax=Paenibacillus mangrovi TaxID=2931978 RepID=A0A9X1WRL8_9BACL|nr:DUF5808 domain-containing protein [Paenibacillus mangrovi]MCJ8012155.1 DUF5808 domain-containing protein [Paenibacillus mangrovi]